MILFILAASSAVIDDVACYARHRKFNTNIKPTVVLFLHSNLTINVVSLTSFTTISNSFLTLW